MRVRDLVSGSGLVALLSLTCEREDGHPGATSPADGHYLLQARLEKAHHEEVSLPSLLLVFWYGQQVPRPGVPHSSWLYFHWNGLYSGHHPNSTWNFISQQAPVSCVLVYPCVLISPDDLSPPQQGPSIVSPPLCQVSMLCSHDGRPLRRGCISTCQFPILHHPPSCVLSYCPSASGHQLLCGDYSALFRELPRSHRSASHHLIDKR